MTTSPEQGQRSPELPGTRYRDIDALHADLNLLGSQGVTHVVLAVHKPGRNRAERSDSYEYQIQWLSNRANTPPLSEYQDGSGRTLVGEADRSAHQGVHCHGWVSEYDFAHGAHVRIVVDPAELEGREFSYDTGDRGRTDAIEHMQFAQRLLLLY